MQLSKTHKFFITFPSESEVQVYPKNSSLSWTFQKQDEILVKKLDTKLEFRNTPEHSTFDKLFQLENSLSPCIEIGIRIEETCICNGTTTIQNWNGLLPFRKGEWDRKECFVKIQPIYNGDLKCVIDEWDEEKDFLTMPQRASVKTIQGELEFIFKNAGEQPVGYGWTVHEEWYYGDDTQRYFLEKVRYVRQKSSTDFGGWTFENGLYYNFVPTGDVTYREQGIQYDQSTDIYSYYDIHSYKIVNLQIDNALTLADIIIYAFADCTSTIVSNFFGINPDLTAPDNGPYRYASDYLQNLLVLKASDVIIATATENATRMELSWKSMYQDLKKMFNLITVTDQANNTIYIEHVTYQGGKKKLNLSQKSGVSGLHAYSYVDEAFPRKETFEFAYPTGSEDFDEAKITYNINCVNQDEENNAVENKCKHFVTNVSKIYNNEYYSQDEYIKDKLVLIASDGSVPYVLGGVYETGILNGPLAMTNLLQNLHTYERPLRYGKMNGVETQFNTVKNQRKQTLTLQMACSTIFDLKPFYDIQTPLGLGTVDEFKIEKPSNKVEITLSV